ncbi:unnamed protein product [Protopolystoma xenopodis]|uniref:Uncharacterized protein n=1 Tax=Protopolystoma xenopodis TaxID=117903 RepID=A0A3S5B2V0_9PLAT|nr:unnamed protein product [Protopolystoma xenopodis]
MPTGQRGHRPESSDGVIVGSSGVSSYTTGSSRQPTPIKLSGYLLKVCCSVAYLYDAEARLLDYEYIQACLSQYGCMPRLSPVLRRDVLASLKPSLHRLMQPRSLTPVSPRQQRSHNQFDIARCPHLVSEDHSSTTKLAHTASGDGDAVSLDWLEPEECIDDWIDHEDSDDEKDHEEKVSH